MFGFLIKNRREAGILLTLATVTLLVYSPVRHYEFVNYDDPAYISENPYVRQGITREGVRWAFRADWDGKDPNSDYWRPLSYLSHMLDVELFGMKPGAHHLTNAGIHAAAAAALFLALRLLTGSIWRSALVAALFALHPHRVESVAWITERKDVLSGLFFFLTLAAYARYAGSASCPQRAEAEAKARAAAGPPKKNCPAGGVRSFLSVLRLPAIALATAGPFSSGWYWTTSLLFVCALMSKPMMVTLPGVLLLLDFWPLGRIRAWGIGHGAEGNRPFSLAARRFLVATRHLILEKLPFFLLALPVAYSTCLASRENGSVLDIASDVRLSNALTGCATYIWKSVWPSRFAVFYPYDFSMAAWKPVVSAGVLLGFTVFSLVLLRRKGWLATGWFWFMGTLLPVSGLLVQAGEQAMADRYAYIPTVGLYIMAAWSLPDFARRPALRRAAAVGCAAFLLLCALMTARQIPVWRDGMTLFGQALRLGYESPVAHNNLGHTLAKVGRNEEAIAHYQRALELMPDHPEANNNLGVELGKQGLLDEALVHFERAIRSGSKFADARNNLGNAYLILNRPEEAVPVLEEAVRLKPWSAEIQNNLGRALAASGHPESAAARFREALRLEPGYADARENLESVAGRTARRNGAPHATDKTVRGQISTLRSFIRKNPADAAALNNLAWLLATGPDESLRDGKEAVGLAERACALNDGDHPGLLDTLAAAYAEAGRFDEAVKTAQQAAELAGLQGNHDLAAKIGARLELYRKGKPFRP